MNNKTDPFDSAGRPVRVSIPPEFSCIGREAITVDATAGGKGFTSAKLTAKTVFARVQIQAAALRATYDGTAPVAATTGELRYPGDVFEVWGDADMAALRMIRESSTSAVAEVSYFGVP